MTSQRQLSLTRSGVYATLPPAMCTTFGVVVARVDSVAVVAEATGLGSGRVRLAAWVVINGLLSIECPGRRGR